MTRASRSALGCAAAAIAAIALVVAPAAATAAPTPIAPPYALTQTAPTKLLAVPALGSSTLAVTVVRNGPSVDFSPAAAAAPGGCASTLLVTSCPLSMIATELALQGGVLDAAVQLKGVTIPLLRLTGGPGNDTMSVDSSTPPDTNTIASIILDPGDGNDEVTINGNFNALSLAGPDPGDDRYRITSNSAMVGTLALGDGNDVATSTAPSLALDGGPGDDVLSGRGDLIGGTGSDVLMPAQLGKLADGGAPPGVDRLSYELFTTDLTLTKSGTDVSVGDGVPKTGIEQLVGGKGNDTLIGTGAPDVLSGGEGDDVIDGRGGGDQLDGGPGTNTVTYALGPSPVTVDLAAGVGGTSPLDSLTSFRRVITGPGNDVVTGTAADEQFTLGAGDDTVSAGDGNDTVDAGPGNDLLRGGEGADVLNGGDGIDTAAYDDRGASEPVNVDLSTFGGDGAAGENDLLPGIENVIGGASNDTLTGDAGPNTLVGGGGLDTIDGGAGDDELHGGDDRDVITGGPGNDRLFGEGEDDSINAFDPSKPDADIVDCGASADDDAQVDATDTVAGCEYARRADVPVPVDADGDGFVSGFDCNDQNPAINQGAIDIPGDGIDQNCDGYDQQVPYVDFKAALLIAKRAANAPPGVRFTRFRVIGLRSDARVDITCKSAPGASKARRCPFKTATKRPAAGATQVSFLSLFKGRRLVPGTKLELRINAPGFNGRFRRYTVTPVTVTPVDLCLTAPSKTPRKCPEGDEL